MDIKSNIVYVESLDMYKLNRGYLSQYFEYFGVFLEKGAYVFGSLPQNVVLGTHLRFSNIVLGTTSFGEGILLSILDTDTQKSQKLFVKKAYIYSFVYQEKEYLVCVYQDMQGNINIYHNAPGEIEVEFLGDTVTVTNTILEVSLVSWSGIDFDSTSQKKINIIQYNDKIDSIDLYYFEDVFGEFRQEDRNIFQTLSEQSNDMFAIKMIEYSGHISPEFCLKIFLQDGDMQYFLPILKILLGFGGDKFLSYTLKNNTFLDDYIKNMNVFDIQTFSTHISPPTDMMRYNPKYQVFQVQINILKYVALQLEQNIAQMEHIKNQELGENAYIDLVVKRLGITYEQAKTMQNRYHQELQKILQKVHMLGK